MNKSDEQAETERIAALTEEQRTAEILAGIFRVGAGPAPGEKWVPVKPAPLGKLRR